MRSLRMILAAAMVAIAPISVAKADADAASGCREIRAATETAPAMQACRLDVYAHVDESKVGNLKAPYWDATKPTGSYSSGAGGALYHARLADYFIWQYHSAFRPPLSGTFSGVVDAVGVTAYLSIPGGHAHGWDYPLLAQLRIDDRVVFENEKVEIDVPLQPHEASPAIHKIQFNFSNVAKRLEQLGMPVDGEHTVSVSFIAQYGGVTHTVVLYDAAEVPTGVQFNLDPAATETGNYIQIDVTNPPSDDGTGSRTRNPQLRLCC